MISNLSLKSFKCFFETEIMISPITLLTGLNSSGKSSVIQALRILTSGKLLEGYGNCVSNLGTEAVIALYEKNLYRLMILHIVSLPHRNLATLLMESNAVFEHPPIPLALQIVDVILPLYLL